MNELEKNEAQNQKSHHTYENDDWIHVNEWMVQKFENGETHEPFWSVTLPSNTSITLNGQTVDIGHYRFTTQREPALTHGEAGTPKAIRGIHFPDGWGITLQRIENVAKEGHDPIFEVTDRIEGVTAKQLSEALDERREAWRSSHKKEHEAQVPGKDEQVQKPGMGMYIKPGQLEKPRRSTEPSL